MLLVPRKRPGLPGQGRCLPSLRTDLCDRSIGGALARIRTVKPDLFISERVAADSVEAMVTDIVLFNHCDDHGRHRGNAAIIAGLIWRLRAGRTPVHAP